jgi:hypothetical protein
VLRTTVGGSQDDTSWERLQRERGGYQPGQFTIMQDQLNQGDNAS